MTTRTHVIEVANMPLKVEVADQRPYVLEGCKWLDQHEPGWADVIDIAAFDLESTDSCVLGQLWINKELGDYGRALEDLDWDETDSQAHGFNIHGDTLLTQSNDAARYGMNSEGWFYEDLTHLWMDQIALRTNNTKREMYADWPVSV